MSFISPDVLQIFCEGETDGPDELLLNHAIRSRSSRHVQVKSAGGKRGLKAFIDGYLRTYAESKPKIIALRDRDFDVPPPSDVALTRLQGEKEIWLTHRAAIENYFIDAALIHTYLADGRTHRGKVPSGETIETIILQSVRGLSDYQAIRWALASLKPGERWPELSSRLNKKVKQDGHVEFLESGTLPSSLAFDDNIKIAEERIIYYHDAVNSVTVAKLHSQAARFQTQFQEASVDDCLVWFHGKDLLKLIRKNLLADCQRKSVSITFEDAGYKEWAAQNVDIENHPDLLQFVERVKHI